MGARSPSFEIWGGPWPPWPPWFLRLCLQIWRSAAPGQYTLVNDTTYTKTANERIATVPVSMSVMAGDMVGFYGLWRLHFTSDASFTMYLATGTTTSLLRPLRSVVRLSPYISIVFSKSIFNYYPKCAHS